MNEASKAICKHFEEKLRASVRDALECGIGPTQVQNIVSEECINAVDYVKDYSNAAD